jgi:predicted DCC family thiol-disulfide oxidoreductase YuxK
MGQLILYYTSDCHLCDEAEGLLHAAGLGESYQKVEIVDDPDLLETYGVHIPVLKRNDNQRELFWPFDALALAEFVQNNG